MLPPKHATFVTTVVPDTGEVGCVTDTVTVPVQPFASVICTEYVPATRPVLSSVVGPDGNQLKVYGPVPPVGVKLIAPVLPPKQATFVTTVVPDTGEVG